MTDRFDNELALLSQACFILFFDRFISGENISIDDVTLKKIDNFRLSFSYKLHDIKTLWNSDNQDVLVNFLLLYEGVGGQRESDYEFSKAELNQFLFVRKKPELEMDVTEANDLVNRFL